MTQQEQESQLALYMAQRSYMYGLLHIVFSAKPSAQTLAYIADQNTVDIFKAFHVLANSPQYAQVINKPIGDTQVFTEECFCHILSGIDQGKGTSDEEEINRISSEFNKLFMVPGPLYVHPWESVYTSSNKMMLQEITLDVRAFYHKAGFKLQTEKHFPDDHIGAMMDYLSKTSQHVYESYADGNDPEAFVTLHDQKDFIEKHLNTWVEEFCEKVIEHTDSPFYPVFACAMVVALRIDALRIDEMLKTIAQ